MSAPGITYKSAGVDIASADEFKRKIKPLARATFSKHVLADIGGFGSFFAMPRAQYREPVLVSSADGVGTKLKIAACARRHDTVGIDAVAMNVNDILCTGAKPLFFLDYIAHSGLSEGVLIDIVKGITNGCRESGCALIGGETAQMPGMYAAGEYDIAGFCVGVVEKKNIINGARIRAGQAVIGLASSGLHSNGYSLVRKALSARQMKEMSSELLTPTRIYVRPVLGLLRASLRPRIHGIAHITGGAFYDKIARILPKGVDCVIRKGSWPVPDLFKTIQRAGGIGEREMFHTLNMGIGMAVIADPSAAPGILRHMKQNSLGAWFIGETVAGSGHVRVE